VATIRQLDVEKPGELETYLRIKGFATKNDSLAIEQLAGGVSNRTMLVNFGDGRAWVVKQALSKLRVAVDWFCDPARIEREAQGLRRLVDLAPPGTITPLVFEDREHHLLAMQAVPQPYSNWKVLLLAGHIEERLVQQFAQLLASIHSRASVQRHTLAAEFADRSFFESLRLEPYYEYSARQVPTAAEFLRELIADTRRRNDTLVHGDYSPKNVLVCENGIVLVDHEVIHWGEPAFDIGFSMTHFLSKAHHLPAYRARFASAARLYWNTYREALGDVGWDGDLERRAVYHTLACLLARVAGRSPLEYLDSVERARQIRVVSSLVVRPPASIHELIQSFLEKLDESN
jgi:5-methylthioribose kinase